MRATYTKTYKDLRLAAEVVSDYSNCGVISIHNAFMKPSAGMMAELSDIEPKMLDQLLHMVYTDIRSGSLDAEDDCGGDHQFTFGIAVMSDVVLGHNISASRTFDGVGGIRIEAEYLSTWHLMQFMKGKEGVSHSYIGINPNSDNMIQHCSVIADMGEYQDFTSLALLAQRRGFNYGEH